MDQSSIKRFLKYGDYKIVARMANVSEEYVSKVLNGKRNSAVVMEKAQEVARMRADELVTELNGLLEAAAKAGLR